MIALPKKRTFEEIEDSSIPQKSKYQRFSDQRKHNRQYLERYIYLFLSRVNIKNPDKFENYVLLNLATTLEGLLYQNRREKNMSSIQFTKENNIDNLPHDVLIEKEKKELANMFENTVVSMEILFQKFICKLVCVTLPATFGVWFDRVVKCDTDAEKVVRKAVEIHSVKRYQREFITFFGYLLSNKKFVDSLSSQITKNVPITDLKFNWK
jgi:hypothetical protein